MTEVVSVRFKSRGKLYYFDPAGISVNFGDSVIVETSKGLELGECAKPNHEVDDDRIVPPLRPLIRVATDEDIRIAENNRLKEKEAFRICQRKISEHGLDMKLVDVEYNFEGSKILFFFTSDGRVDFRELVKDLASVFRTRIELRQIGVRDEAKMLGGLGVCGRPFCCSQFLDDFQPVSTKMAKSQSMSLNPTKISGSCGRLMCCLRYEQEAYEDLIKTLPKAGAFVQTPEGYGVVMQVNLLRRMLKVRIDGTSEQVLKSFSADEVAAIPGGRPKNGDEMPSLLIPPVLPEPEPEPEEFSYWADFLYEPDPPKPADNSRDATDAEKTAQRKIRNKPAGDGKPANANKPAMDNKPPEERKPNGNWRRGGNQRQADKTEPKNVTKPKAEQKPRPAQTRRFRRNKPSN